MVVLRTIVLISYTYQCEVCVRMYVCMYVCTYVCMDTRIHVLVRLRVGKVELFGRP